MNSTLWHLVGKEFLELRRDRRVLFMAVLMPILLYPGIMGLTSYMERKQETEVRAKSISIALVGELAHLLREE